MLVALFLAVLLLTYSNGANDNFKGVATLWGSGTLNYRQALTLATIATFAGSTCSYFFAETFVKNFSGNGLVPDEIIGSAEYVLAVAGVAGLTVLLATWLGFPISTTHGLVGALLGAGLLAARGEVNFSKLWSSFFLPLVAGPVLTAISCAMFYSIFSMLRKKNRENATQENIDQSHSVTLADKVINALHIMSAAVVSFARGLNDAPKLISLLLLCNFFSMQVNFVLLASLMAVAGILNAKKVANTMSKKIVKLNHGQGFSANFVTGCLVIAASTKGLQVSTTHVSVGSIFGIGLINKSADTREISKVILSWLLTLPVAGIIAAILYFIIH